MPAGTDTKVRTPGITRPQNTTATPWRRNQRRLAARAAGLKPNQVPWRAAKRSSRRSLIKRPRPYQHQAPSTLPSTPARITGTSSSRPSCTR